MSWAPRPAASSTSSRARPRLPARSSVEHICTAATTVRRPLPLDVAMFPKLPRRHLAAAVRGPPAAAEGHAEVCSAPAIFTAAVPEMDALHVCHAHVTMVKIPFLKGTPPN